MLSENRLITQSHWSGIRIYWVTVRSFGFNVNVD